MKTGEKDCSISAIPPGQKNFEDNQEIKLGEDNELFFTYSVSWSPSDVCCTTFMKITVVVWLNHCILVVFLFSILRFDGLRDGMCTCS